MLVFSEGVPRSGKSYDAVKNHILPALKKGRRVYARLNGLNHERIAAYLKLPLERVQDLLIPVPTDQVRETFVALQDDETGQWTIDAKFKNALVVIDEVHEFYVGGTREPLPPAIEQFFALHGHYGMDILTMTQFYKRVHTAIRYRIERKSTFQKMSALGKKGESLYRETAWQTVAPDKYEKVGGVTKAYDKDIFALYHGIVGGIESDVAQDVYDGGRVTVWRKLLVPALIVVPLGLFSIWFLLDFFSGGGTALVKQTTVAAKPVPVQPATAGVPNIGTPFQPDAAPRPGQPVKVKTEKEKHLEAMSPEQQYVWQLTEKGRIRFAGSVVGSSGQHRGYLEWYDGSENVLDRLSLQQVRSMGVVVDVMEYGVKLAAHGEAIVATAWPLTRPVRDREPRLYDTSGGGAGASEASPTAAPGGAALVAAASALGGSTGTTATPYGAPPRASGTFALDPQGGAR